jgi:hypothetical protein
MLNWHFGISFYIGKNTNLKTKPNIDLKFWAFQPLSQALSIKEVSSLVFKKILML